jgi:hypothetical protein
MLTILVLSQVSYSQIILDTLKSKRDPRYCDLMIVYPVCKNKNAKTLNDSVTHFLRVEKEQFLQQAKPYYSDMDQETIESRQYPRMSVEVLSTYSNDFIVSYCLEMNECPSWGCHGTAKYLSFTYDLIHKRFLNPKDIILTPDTGVCRIVRAYVDSIEYASYTDWQYSHPKCQTNDFNINVDQINIVFNFSAYDLGPGCYRVFIPRQKFILNIKNDAAP